MFIPLYDYNPLRYLTRPYANYALILANIVVFFMTGGFDQYAVENAAVGYGFIPSVVNDFEDLPAAYVRVPEDATYITYAFLHANWLHLGGNMLFLWVFGDNVEDAVGRIRYVLFYLACAAAGAFVHSSVNPASPTPLIGASGAVAGVVGAYLILHPRAKLWVLAFGKIPLRLSATWVLGAWALFQVFNIFVVIGEEAIAWWAHVGGMAAGAALILVLRRRGVALFDRSTPKPASPRA
jgi:membrane associated rhomboid family serine protease